MTTLEPQATLDLRTTKCPLNFVKAKLALEKLSVGQILEVWILLEAESALNIPKSMTQEGHRIVKTTQDTAAGLQKLWIERSH
jgi:TusA-related sulfurtransferase